MAKIGSRIKHAWNAFTNKDEEEVSYAYDSGAGYGNRPDRMRVRLTNERSIVQSIYTRLAIDVAQVNIRHVRIDENDQFVEEMDSGLNNCLTIEANIDQAATEFRQDIAMSLFDKGFLALVPVDTDLNPNKTGGYDIRTMRVGEIITWYPEQSSCQRLQREAWCSRRTSS